MKKHILLGILLTLSVLMLLCVSALAASSGTCGNNLTYTLDDNGTLTIRGTGAISFSNYNGAPWFLKGVVSVYIEEGVTSIGKNAFYGCRQMTNITIPSSVTSIGYQAFYSCSELTGITIPNSVTFIDNQAFERCSSLTSITIPNNVTFIGGKVFEYCRSLTSIVIPDSVQAIGNEAFHGCTALTSITIPDSVDTVQYNAFSGCSGLSTIIYHGQTLTLDGVKSFGTSGSAQWIIGNNHALYVWGDGNLGDYDQTNPWKTEEIFSAGILNGVTSIGDYNFYGCSGLTSIMIPDSVTSIGRYAFISCSSLTSITIPDGVTSIGENTFYGCSSLTSITIPDSVTSIGHGAFNNCTSLKSITIPDSVTSIGDYAFDNCRSLTSITIPDSVTSIGDYAFGNCRSLTSVTIPDSVTSIDNHAFNNCNSLTSIITPTCDCYANVWLRNNGFNALVHAETHPEVIMDAAVEPTCSSTGLTEGSHCANCGEIIVAQNVIPKEPHTPVIDPAVPATCSANGHTEGSHCTVCGAIVVAQNDIPKIAHSPVTDPAIPATDTCSGLTEGSHCSVCGEVLVAQQTIPPLWSIETVDGGVTILKYNGASAMCSIPTNLEELPVTSIASGAFADCNNLNKVFIPSCVTSISMTAFDQAVTVYCYEYTEADYWADDVGYSKVYVNQSEDYYQVSLPADFTLEWGNSRTLEANVFPILGNEEFLWSSSDPECVSVSDGAITALLPGTSVITLQVGSQSASVQVTVHADPESFEIASQDGESAPYYIISKETKQLLVEDVFPAGAELSLTWTTSDERVATVSSAGLVTAKRSGNAVITATSQNGISQSCSVVICAPVTAIELETDHYTVETGRSFQMNVTVRTSDNSTIQNKLVTYSSTNDLVASVNEDGVIISKNRGSAVITVAGSVDIQATATIDVTCPNHHFIVLPAVEPTCEESGLGEGEFCPICGEKLNQETIPALGHNYELIEEMPAAVGREGTKLYECSRCGARQTEVTDALVLGHQLLNKTWKIIGLNKGSTYLDESEWGNFASFQLIFNSNGDCTYKTVNRYGNLYSGSSTWTIDSEGYIYMPSFNSLYNMSSSSLTAMFKPNGTIFITMYVNSRTYYATLTPMGQPINDQEEESGYIGTWKADHIYRDNGVRFSCSYWPSVAGTTIVVNADNTILVNGEEGTWTYSYGIFYVDGEADTLQVNELGQMLFQLTDFDYLVLTRNGYHALPAAKKLKLPSGLKRIEDEAFYGTKAEEVIIPDGCTYIGSKAFANSRKLNIVLIPSSVKTIANNAFSGTDASILCAEDSYAASWAVENNMDLICLE